MDAPPTTLAERYIVEEPIAKGGMATVWRARDEILARAVAVKILHEHLAEDPSFVERFHREALAAARLTHPHIVAIYDTGREQRDGDGTTRHYIIMELCEGGSLADLVAREGPLEAERAVSIGASICDALAYAAEQGVVHRDVKPANVLISDAGTIKVADFGIAKAAFEQGDITTTGAVLGTVTYISPEQARGEEPDHRSDLYSLGVVLYELLTGRPPFRAESPIATAMQHLHDAPPPPRTLRPSIPRGVERVVMRALEKNRDARFASAAEMRRALEGWSAYAVAGRGTSVMRSARSAPEQAPVPVPGQSRWVVGVLALVAVAVALALVVPRLLGAPAERETGGDGRAGSRTVDVATAGSFDPYGDGEEHQEEAPLAADGDRSTSWSTETYSAPLDLLDKPGVGLVFELAEPAEVSAVEVRSSVPGFAFELRAADELGDDETDFEEVARAGSASATQRLSFAPRSVRYWLLWITRLPDGGVASISEVTFLAS